MSEVGTLKKLNVKPGDVVEGVLSGSRYTIAEGLMLDSVPIGKCLAQYRLISRAEPSPKLWRDMTPEEKGALLLAHHEGKVIEWTGYRGSEFRKDSTEGKPVWDDNHAYRVKPEPKVETVEMNGADVRFSAFFKGHKITFKTIDGKPDCASIKMEKL